MTSLTTMYDGQANSPAAVLAVTLTIAGGSCTVDDDSLVPAAPMLLVIGADHDDAETVLMTAKPGADVLTITRAQDGTTAKEWAAGTKVQRCFTNYDYNTLIDNIEALNTAKLDMTTSGDAKRVYAVGADNNQALIGFDATPTDSSTNLLDSNAVYDGLAAKADSGHNHDSTYVSKSTYNADTVLYATTDNTPAALEVTEQTLVGRVTGGHIAAIAIDADLSSVSANDDTVPSAKATKALADLKEAKLATVTRLTDNVTLAEANNNTIYVPHASTAYTLNIPANTLSKGWWCAVLNDTGGDVNVDPAASGVSLNGTATTITIDADNEIAFLICTDATTDANLFEIRGNI